MWKTFITHEPELQISMVAFTPHHPCCSSSTVAANVTPATQQESVRSWSWRRQAQVLYDFSFRTSARRRHPQQQICPDKRDHQNCLSPTLAYNTSPHHSSTTLPSVQHSSPTLPYNSSSQQHHRYKKRTDTKTKKHHQTHHQRKRHNTAAKTWPHHRMTITLPKNTTTPQKHNHTTTKNTTTPQHTTPKRKNITQNTKLRTCSAPIFFTHSDDCATSQVHSAKQLPTSNHEHDQLTGHRGDFATCQVHSTKHLPRSCQLRTCSAYRFLQEQRWLHDISSSVHNRTAQIRPTSDMFCVLSPRRTAMTTRKANDQEKTRKVVFFATKSTPRRKATES